MRSYRIFFLDERGHVRGAEEFEAERDDDAIRRARERADHGTLELWNLSRFVARVNRSSRPQVIFDVFLV